MLAKPPNPATIAVPPSTTRNPATIPLPQTPPVGGAPDIPRAGGASYFSSPATEGHQHRYEETGGRHVKYRSELGDRRASTTIEHSSLDPTTVARWVGGRDPKLPAGVAASIALRNHRPVEVVSPELNASAGHAAAMAAKEVKAVHIRANEPLNFANSAAVLAHKAAKPAAAVASTNLAQSSTSGVGGAESDFARDTSNEIHDAASKTISKTLSQATERTLAATENPPPRRMVTANMHEAARKAAERRLALLDQEMYEAGVLRRIPFPDRNSESKPSGSPRRSYSLREGSTLQSRKAPVSDVESYTNLLDIARRNVENRLAGIDLQIADKKGLVYRRDWDNQATRIAESRTQSSNEKISERHGKYNVGGGKFVDAEVVDRIAMRNVQPLLDEMNAKAEVERARIATEKADIEERKRLENLEKERNRGIKEENRRARAAEKAEISRRKTEAKREKRLSKDGASREQPSYNGTTEPAIATGPPQPTSPEPKSKLKKLIGRLRRSSSPPPSSYEGERFVGGAHLAQQREMDRGKAPEAGPGENAITEAPQLASHVIPPQDRSTVEGGSPVAAKNENEPGESHGNRVEYIDPEDNQQRESEGNAGGRIEQLESFTTQNESEPLARKFIDRGTEAAGGDAIVDIHPTHQPNLFPSHLHNKQPDPSQMSDGGYSVSTPGYPELHYPPPHQAEESNIPGTQTTFGTHDMEHLRQNIPAPAGEERNPGTAHMYDRSVRAIDVTVIRTISQERERTRLSRELAETDLYDGRAPLSKGPSKGKSVRIEDPPATAIAATTTSTTTTAIRELSGGGVGVGLGPKESKFREEL